VIALDLSRLLSRTRCTTPTGIDRVELAYARHLIGGSAPYCFAARNPLGRIGLLPAALSRQFVAGLGALWRDGAVSGRQQRLATLAWRLRLATVFGERALHDTLRDSVGGPVYLSVSHQNLDRALSIARLKAATGARFLCLIHDLIPLEFPDLTRPGQTRRHQRRIETVAALADAVITNSAATRDALLERLRTEPQQPPVAVAPLGIDLPDVPTLAEEPPYFVCIGTIEARKNHRLLLDLWRRLAVELGDPTPRLILIGQRGFGGERIADALQTLRGRVIERADLSDTAMAALLRGARALLLPSLAEGFGLPVVEALASGVPVLCSDLPALRESGGNVPDYLDPLDTEAWHRAVLDYASESPRRQAQLDHLKRWRPPCWATHFAIVERLIDELC
jgi:glycosyltransferase involved in cell wall biosynthesis